MIHSKLPVEAHSHKIRQWKAYYLCLPFWFGPYTSEIPWKKTGKSQSFLEVCPFSRGYLKLLFLIFLPGRGLIKDEIGMRRFREAVAV